MELKQQLRLTQQLVMTPQLQQAIRLLQLSRLELIDEVRKELDGNPILAEDEPADHGQGAAQKAPAPSEIGEHAFDDQQEPRRTDQDRETEKATREVDWE